IRFDVKATGFHFMLDKRVPGTMEGLAPSLHELARELSWNAADLDFYVIHAGGPRILDDLSRFLGPAPHAFDHSRATLTGYGNIASAVVLETLRRTFEESPPERGAHGLIAGFGPGITAEITLGSWVPAARETPLEAIPKELAA